MIQTLIFDLGGVLIEDPSTAILAYCADYLRVDGERIVEALRTFWHPWHRGTILEREIWEQVATDLGIPCPQCTSLWLDGFMQVHRERPEMLLLLKQLKRQGYTTALLSNIEMPLANYFKQHPFADIDHCFYSCE
ncbi:MAG TPA: hypothetical protein VFV38_14500, partial [Ktedonobacteraceae bacterium]|nr:hypothetical protein [Ktedonobacteraceae bacterium]